MLHISSRFWIPLGHGSKSRFNGVSVGVSVDSLGFGWLTEGCMKVAVWSLEKLSIWLNRELTYIRMGFVLFA